MGSSFFSILTLFIGLILIVEPIRIILNRGPELLNFPILNIIKPIADIIGQSILFLWDSFSFLGSFVLTAILTTIIYFLVNYTLMSGVSVGVLMIVMFVLNSKKN